MATRVYKEVDITLQDGTEVTLRPLPIGPLRRFMDAWSKFAEIENEDQGFDVFVNCAGIALEKDFKKLGLFDSLKATEAERKKGQFLSKEYKEHLEDILDLDTIYEILEVCGGLKLNQDPKEIQELMDAMGTEEPGDDLDLAKLEAEAMLLGIWKNVEELEMYISIDELQAIIQAARDREYRQQKFAAALKGINLDEQSEEEAREKFERVKVRAEARARGENPDHAEFESMGLDIEVD